DRVAASDSGSELLGGLHGWGCLRETAAGARICTGAEDCWWYRRGARGASSRVERHVIPTTAATKDLRSVACGGLCSYERRFLADNAERHQATGSRNGSHGTRRHTLPGS